MRPGEHPVTLHDGREVSSYSDDWRHECECRWLLVHKPTRTEKHLWLYGVPDRRRIMQDDGKTLRDDWKTLTQVKSITHVRGLTAADRILADARKIYEAEQAS